ncbi:TetR family transcriptional regulator [Candidatus Nanohaloarchaea archaeon]|nr:TetR family transcriptional regulator [Candidatus Nanohaloarchaea archaeon]
MGERKTSEERREQILETALEILHEEGRSRLTVGRIAEKISISEAAVYRHFDSKEEIIRKMAEKVFSIELVDPEELSFEAPKELLEEIIRGIFAKLEEDRKIASVLFHDELFTEYPEVEEIFREHRKEKKEKLKNLVIMGKTSGLFNEEVDPDTFARTMMGSIRITVLEWRDAEFSHSLEEEVRPLAQHLAKILQN